MTETTTAPPTDTFRAALPVRIIKTSQSKTDDGRRQGIVEAVISTFGTPYQLDNDTWHKHGSGSRPCSPTQLGSASAQSGSYLLTGLLRCGRCGTTMVATPRRTKTGGGKRGVYVYGTGATQRAYGCAKSSGGCGGLFILAEGADAFVRDAVLYRLRGRHLGEARQRLSWLGGADELLREIAEDEAMLVDLGEDYAERRISRSAFHAAVDRVQARLDVARARLASQSRPDVLADVEDLSRDWDALGLERQRAVIAAVLAEVTVGPANGPRNRFDPNRIRFHMASMSARRTTCTSRRPANRTVVVDLTQGRLVWVVDVDRRSQ